MNNNHESMPNQAPEPKKPDFSEDDIGSLIESFKEGRSEEERAESSASIESMIAETIKELDEQEAQREAEKAAKEKNERVERTGIVYGEASKVAAETLKDSLSMALQMADTPEGAVLLVNPVHERLQKVLDPHGGFNKLHDDPRVQELYRVFTDKIRHEAVMAVKTGLEKELGAPRTPKRSPRCISCSSRSKRPTPAATRNEGCEPPRKGRLCVPGLERLKWWCAGP